ncbi:hypothetical protein TRICI_006222 [Trichomonascus ciferrii]|uniref:Pre-mRNA-splicing factor CWC22 n=1 Tax=Trichomonascus ciferrii TaxID=44093 RepID=A0A642UNX1_9ASCO|nr:hypothetical protein TRICI_006222 [Trichomonascus ciferrii]
MSGRKDTYRPAEGVKDVDRERARERERQERERAQEREEENDKPKSTVDPVAEYKRLTEMRSGGRYVPPAKLRALQEAMVASQSPKDFQRVEWEKLKKSINRYINQVNVSNIREVVRNVFSQNLIRGRGIFVRSIMKAQAASLTYTNVYATLAAIVNSKLPQVGELLVTRLVVQFRRAYRRNNKAACISSSMFLAHLCNHQVAHEVVCLQMLHLLLEKPTNDSVEIAVGFMRQIGAYLSEFSPAAATGVFERFRTILHEGNVETRIQYMIEVLFQVRKEGYKDHPVIAPGLDLVEEDDQITHMIGLDDTGLKTEDGLNVFQFDKDYEENEQKYNRVKEEILGDEDEEDEEDESSSEEEQEEEKAVEAETGEKVVIKDMTNTELINLRKSIYLTIMSSMSMQEITHKLVRIEVPKGNEIEVVNMVVECCAQEKTYNKIFGGVSTQLCRLNRKWHDLFKGAFKDYYGKIHRYKTLQIRNIATLFGYLLASDGLSWEVFEAVYISEEHTTSSSRIFIKFLFEEMQQELGVKQLKERFAEDYIQPYISTLFPKTTREETMFAINFFTVLHLATAVEAEAEVEVEAGAGATAPPVAEATVVEAEAEATAVEAGAGATAVEAEAIAVEAEAEAEATVADADVRIHERQATGPTPEAEAGRILDPPVEVVAAVVVHTQELHHDAAVAHPEVEVPDLTILLVPVFRDNAVEVTAAEVYLTHHPEQNNDHHPHVEITPHLRNDQETGKKPGNAIEATLQTILQHSLNDQRPQIIYN